MNPSNHAMLIRRLAETLRCTRESSDRQAANDQFYILLGMTTAGWLTGYLTSRERERLNELAINACAYCRREHCQQLGLYTWKEVPATTQEAAA